MSYSINFLYISQKLFVLLEKTYYNAFNVYRRELAPSTVSLTGNRAQGDDSKHWAYSTRQHMIQFY